MRTKHGLLDFMERNSVCIAAIQETWLAKQELHHLSSLSASYCAYGAAKIDYEDGLTSGRNSGGVAFIWNNSVHDLFLVNPVDLCDHWLVGLELIRKTDNARYLIVNVYLPYKCDDNRDTYMACVSRIQQVVEDANTTNIMICGDFNCDPRQNDFFAETLNSFCIDTGLLISDQLCLPNDAFTFVSDCWDTTSWIDHFLCSCDFHGLINNLTIDYGLTWSDHHPIIANLYLTLSPECSDFTQESVFHTSINWDTPGIKEDYFARSDIFSCMYFF